MPLCYVTAQAQALPGKTEELRQCLRAAVAPVRQEPGCLRYDLHQHTEAADTFLFYEIWQDAAALQVHSQASNLTNLVQQITPLLAKPLAVDVWQAEDVQA